MEVVNITPSNVDEYDDNFLNSGDYECFVKIQIRTRMEKIRRLCSIDEWKRRIYSIYRRVSKR
jgi:hypothetical protein